MVRRKNIEHLSRYVDGTYNKENHKVYTLIGFPDKKGDYSVNVVRCLDKCICEAFAYYGYFTNDEINMISALSVGAYKNWVAENCMVIRIA